MYFAEGLSSLFATHPPLDERIRRLDPQWDGKYPPALPADAVVGVGGDEAAGFVGEAPATDCDVCEPCRSKSSSTRPSRSPIRRRCIASTSDELVAAMPPPVVDAAHEPYGARALIFATLLDRDADIRAGTASRARTSRPSRTSLSSRSSLVPAGQPARRAGPPAAGGHDAAGAAGAEPVAVPASSCSASMQLVQADQRLGLFEWTLHQILLRHLRPQFEPVRPPQIVYYGLQQLGRASARCLLSALARASQHDDDVAFEAGAQHLPEVPRASCCRRKQCGLERAGRRRSTSWPSVAPKQRARLVDACAACICADADGERRRRRAAAGDLRHARLPDAAAAAGAGGVAVAVRCARTRAACSMPRCVRMPRRSSRRDATSRSTQRLRASRIARCARTARDSAPQAARVLLRARISRSRNAAARRRNHSRAAHRADPHAKTARFCRRRPSCT